MPPDPPEKVAISYANGTVSITWVPPVDDGGEPITGYGMLRGTSPGDLEEYETLGVVMSFEDTSVNHGYTYYYQLVAVNGQGRGDPSEKVNVLVPEIQPPSPPPGVILARVGDTVVVTWQPPVEDGGSPIIEYRVFRGTGAGPIDEVIFVGDTETYIDENIKKGKTYHYQVIAMNAKKDSEPSEVMTIKIPKDPSNSTPFGSEWLLLAAVIAGVTIRRRNRH
jgi:hypothetical protein